MKNYVFYDLESTVIDSWESGKLLHHKITRICKALNHGSYDCVGVFSYAIYNDNDVNDFISRISPSLPFVLRDNIIIPSRDDFIKAGEEHGGMLIKREMFIVYCMKMFPGGSFHLFDDDESIKEQEFVFMKKKYIFGFTNTSDLYWSKDKIEKNKSVDILASSLNNTIF